MESGFARTEDGGACCDTSTNVVSEIQSKNRLIGVEMTRKSFGMPSTIRDMMFRS